MSFLFYGRLKTVLAILCICSAATIWEKVVTFVNVFKNVKVKSCDFFINLSNFYFFDNTIELISSNSIGTLSILSIFA